MSGDLTRLTQRLFPDKDGEGAVRHRAGIVQAIHNNGTVDLLMDSGIVENVSVLAGAVVEPADVVQINAWPGDMLVLGRWGVISPGAQNSFTPVLRGSTTDPTLGTGSSASGFWAAQGRFADVEFDVTFGGSGTDAGSGAYLIEVPPEIHPVAPVGTAIGHVHLVGTDPNDADDRRAWQLVVGSPFDPLLGIRGTGDGTSRIASNSIPWAWGAGHRLLGSARYRIGTPIPSDIPHLENLGSGQDGSNTLTRSVALSSGTADKFVIIATTLVGIPQTPTGWTDIGLTTSGNHNLKCFVRAGTSETSISVSLSQSNRAAWFTGDIVGGDLSAVEVASLGGSSSGETPTLPDISASTTTNWLVIGAACRPTNFSGVTFPPTLPDDQDIEEIANINDARICMASGQFINTASIVPGQFVFGVGGFTRRYTIAIPPPP